MHNHPIMCLSTTLNNTITTGSVDVSWVTLLISNSGWKIDLKTQFYKNEILLHASSYSKLISIRVRDVKAITYVLSIPQTYIEYIVFFNCHSFYFQCCGLTFASFSFIKRVNVY